MKLESLKSDKFEAFKGLEVKNPLAIVGGLKTPTSYNTYTTSGQHISGPHSDMWLQGDDMGDTARSIHWGEGGDMVGKTGNPIPEETEEMFHRFEVAG